MVFQGVCIGGSLEGQKMLHFEMAYFNTPFESPQYAVRDMDKPLTHFTERYDWTPFDSGGDGVWVHESINRENLWRYLVNQFYELSMEKAARQDRPFRTGLE